MSDLPAARHLPSAEFAARAAETARWIAAYWDRLASAGKPPDQPTPQPTPQPPELAGAAPPVLSAVAPGAVRAALPPAAPEHGDAWEDVWADFERAVMPGITHWQHPSFFAFFPANASGPAVLGELLAAGLGVNGMLWATSPACTELETLVLDQTAALLGLPDRFLSTSPAARGSGGGGVIQGTASEAALVVLCAARHRARRAGAPEHGPFAVYASTQAHSSVAKAAMVAGVATGPEDSRGIRLVPADGAWRLKPGALERMMAEDRAAGRTPLMVCATVGTTSSMASDGIAEVARAAAGHGAWVHVDAAMAGAAAVCPEHRWMLAGLEQADSFCFNPHKWLLTNFDCDLLYTADRASLTGALSITPEYLRNPASAAGAVIDYRDWQVPLGRRFRALKLWFVLRHYGAEGLRAYVRAHVEIARRLESWIAADDRFEVLPRGSGLSLVCFRLRGGPGADPAADARNKALLDRVNASGLAYLTHTVLPREDGSTFLVLRIAVGGTFTEERHVRACWDLIRAEAARARAAG